MNRAAGSDENECKSLMNKVFGKRPLTNASDVGRLSFDEM